MAKTKLLNIDAEFEDVAFDEAVISYRTATLEQFADERQRKKRSESQQQIMADLDRRQIQSNFMKGKWEDDEFRKKKTEHATKQFASRLEEHKALLRELYTDPSKNPAFKGAVIGTPIKKGLKPVRLVGNREMKAGGFEPGAICNCINGKPGFKSHKGYTWTRE